jgi:hypothetical protein
MCVLAIVGIALAITVKWLRVEISSPLWWGILIFSAIYLWLGVSGVWTSRRRYPAAITPDELRTEPSDETCHESSMLVSSEKGDDPEPA